MADVLGQKISLGLSRSFTPPPVPPKPPKVAAQHVDNFSEFNLGKKVPKPKIQKIHGQTFRS